jgi:radical SAM superfamily enzyme YgiQ (UPF0313 family)
VSLGFESGCENILQAMTQHFGVKEIREASRLLAEFGIRCMGFLLLGGLGETRASVEESLTFADSLNLDALKSNIEIRIHPQTELARRAVAEGLVAPTDPRLHPRFYLVEKLWPWLRETVPDGCRAGPTAFFDACHYVVASVAISTMARCVGDTLSSASGLRPGASPT